MIGTVNAEVIALVYLVFAGVLGIGAGGLTCLVLRRRWSIHIAFVDGVFAFVVAFISAEALPTRVADMWTPVVNPFQAIGAISVVARHLVLRARSRHAASRTGR